MQIQEFSQPPSVYIRLCKYRNSPNPRVFISGYANTGILPTPSVYMRLCKYRNSPNPRVFISGYANTGILPTPECLYQAMQIQEFSQPPSVYIRLCKYRNSPNPRVFISGYANTGILPTPECLYQAMQTQENLFYCFHEPLKTTTREKIKNSFQLIKTYLLTTLI